MKLRVRGIGTEWCKQIWNGGGDAYGRPPLLESVEGTAAPCRHCLRLIPAEEKKLVLAYRPFDGLHPYAETGPIFLHAAPCERYDADTLPAWFDHLDPAILRGYSAAHRIRYDTGRVLRGTEIGDACAAILRAPDVAYMHIRSKFNCFQCRVDRA